MSINFKSVPSGALRAGKAGQTESSRRGREGQIPSLPSFLSFSSPVSLFLLSPLPLFFSPHPQFFPPSSSLLPGSLHLYTPSRGSYGDSGLAVNCVWCNPRGFYNRDFHPFFLSLPDFRLEPLFDSFPFPPSSRSRLLSISPPHLLLSTRLPLSFPSSSSAVFFTPVLLLSRRLIVRDWFSNRFLTAPFFAD